MADDYEGDIKRDDAPCPVGNRWGHEIDRLNVEVRSLRHRASNSEQISTLQGAAMKSMEDDLIALKADLWGSAGTPGVKIDVDRLKQSQFSAKDMAALENAAKTLRQNIIIAWATLGTVVLMAIGIALSLLRGTP